MRRRAPLCATDTAVGMTQLAFHFSRLPIDLFTQESLGSSTCVIMSHCHFLLMTGSAGKQPLRARTGTSSLQHLDLVLQLSGC